MNPVSKMIEIRWTSVRRRKRTATIQRIVSAVITACLALQIISSAIIPATLFDVIQTVFASSVLVIMWFYSATEKHSAQIFARGLAGDLLVGVATAHARNPRFVPTAGFRAMASTGNKARAMIEIAPSQSGTTKVAMRVANERQTMIDGLRVRNTRPPRISSIPDEYRFTPEDVQDIMESMTNDPHNIATYRIILNLIEASKDD